MTSSRAAEVAATKAETPIRAKADGGRKRFVIVT
jgi:hypothetical protein